MLLLLTLWVFTPMKKELVETHSLLPFIFTLSWTRISISCVGQLHNQIDKRVILIASSDIPVLSNILLGGIWNSRLLNLGTNGTSGLTWKDSRQLIKFSYICPWQLVYSQHYYFLESGIHKKLGSVAEKNSVWILLEPRQMARVPSNSPVGTDICVMCGCTFLQSHCLLLELLTWFLCFSRV